MIIWIQYFYKLVITIADYGVPGTEVRLHRDTRTWCDTRTVLISYRP